jgi:ribosomal protein L11 methyltransferase
MRFDSLQALCYDTDWQDKMESCLKRKRNMKWKKFIIKTVADAEDIIISALCDIGMEGAQIEDQVPLTAREKEQMFVDIPLMLPENDDTAILSFYVEEQSDNTLLVQNVPKQENEILEEIKAELDSIRNFMDIGEGTVSVDETEDIDWINNWKQFFHQFTIEDLLVIPSWETVEPKDHDKKILHIDPGTAFGTGMHETTQLCIRQIKKYIQPQAQILDVGTGSGILGIIALMYGAGHVVGTDLDPCAIPAVEENLKTNGISQDQFDLILGNIISDQKIQEKAGTECFDIVTANILAEVLVPLTPVIVPCMKHGAVYITSGIIEGKETIVSAAAREAGLEILEVTRQGEWFSVTVRRN